MTFHHFVNCFALAYAPYYLTYKYSGLYDYRAIWKCVQAGLFYILTQLIKMLILATFFPSADISESSSALEAVLRNTLDLIDFGGVYYVLNRIPGKGPGKVLVTGVGWGAAELFLNRFVLLWVGARGMEFDWKYLQLSFDANLSLVYFLSIAALVWLYSRNDFPSNLLPLVCIFLVGANYIPTFLDMLTRFFGVSGVLLLGIKTVMVMAVAAVSTVMFSVLN
ncbi:BOS complex subunit TMEM147-like isoform X2 [Artemia franciscana]|uniref:BOS complex subunit TMEM147-like isoform X1 n=1 Tax=Artemia franciscana TaxID=6661 RepID=UPI0032DA2FD4